MPQQKEKRKKILHKVVRFQGAKRNSRETFMEFGWVENPTFNNDIYLMVVSAHKSGDGLWFLRTDEALIYIQGLSMTLNKKITGINIEKLAP